MKCKSKVKSQSSKTSTRSKEERCNWNPTLDQQVFSTIFLAPPGHVDIFLIRTSVGMCAWGAGGFADCIYHFSFILHVNVVVRDFFP